MVTCYAVHAASELSRSPARRFCSWVFVSLSQGCKILEGNTPAALASVASKIVASVDVLVAWLPKQKLKLWFRAGMTRACARCNIWFQSTAQRMLLPASPESGSLTTTKLLLNGPCCVQHIIVYHLEA